MLASIAEAHALKSDGVFQLQRVTTLEPRTFLVKFAVADWQGAEDDVLREEFRLFDALRSDSLLVPLNIQLQAGKLAAVYRDYAGVPLSRETFATLVSSGGLLAAVQALCEPLKVLHEHDWIVAGLSPQSFLCDATQSKLVLADAPLARRVPTIPIDQASSRGLTPYLPYAPPEIIGRAPLPVDCRADLYALGSILYTLLCGRPPFESSDRSELIQCHLAKTPTPLSELAPELPAGFADLIMRLLSKGPAQRFANVSELEEAAAAVLSAPLRPAPRAAPDPISFSVSNPEFGTKLFGVENALRRLADKLSRTRSVPEVVLVRGPAGVGKTSLLLRVRDLVANGQFCHGKFDHSAAVTPLSGWAAALGELATGLLTRSRAELATWQTKLSAALNESAGLISALAPEWSLILKSEGRRVDDGVDGGLNRLAVAVHSVLRCFARADSPLVLVLDDLQWADQSSLRILEFILTLREPINVVVLVAVRDSVDMDPSALELLKQCEAAELEVDEIRLVGWQGDVLREFIGESFGSALVEQPEFCDLLLARTDGNPLFVQALLNTLIAQRKLTCDPRSGTWTCDIAAIRALPPADSVVDLLASKLVALDPALEDALRTAACLGTRFLLSEYAAATGQRRDDVVVLLERAVGEGMLRARPAEPSVLEPAYEFPHDRVLEACRSSMSESEFAARCLELGRTWLAQLRVSAAPNALHAHRIAGYYYTARQLIDTDQERLLAAELNLIAGRWTKQGGAFSQALEYFVHGLEFLARLDGSESARPHDLAWQQHAELTRELFEETAEAALVNGNFELMHELCGTLLARLESPLQRVRTYEIRVFGLSTEQHFPEAAEAAREVLRELGVTFPKNPKLLHTIAAYVRTRRKVLSGPIERLRDLPAPERTPLIAARSRMLRAMYSCAYFGHRQLFPLVVCTHIDHSLRCGNDDYSCATYVALAMVLCARQDFDNADRLADVVLHLLQDRAAERHRAQAFVGVYGIIYPWKRHLRDTLPHLMEATTSGLLHGEFEFVGHLLTLDALARLHCGSSLAELAPEFEQRRAKLASLRQTRSVVLMQLVSQIVANLRDGAPNVEALAGPFYDDAAMLPRCLEPLDHNLAFQHFLAKLFVCLMLGDHDGALEASRSGRRYLEQGAFALYYGSAYAFWEALAWLICARKQPALRGQALRRAGRTSRRLERFARSAPMNFLHKYHLVEAELCRAKQRWDQAALHFERAVELAQTHGYMHEAAFAMELAAAFYLSRGLERLGRSSLRDCYALYARWGARAVNRRLEQSYPQHFAEFAARSDPGEGARLGPLADDLDYRVLLRSSQAISGEVRLPKLLERLLRAMFEHAGAQRALLILEQNGRLLVEAEADVDRGNLELVRDENAEESARLCQAVVHYVSRTGTPLVLSDAAQDERFKHDEYMQSRKPKSLLCTPLHYQGRLVGLAYLENKRVSHVFTQARVEIVNLLASQAAISIASARYHALELEIQQAKINPHFLFNALSSIAELAIEDGPRTESAILRLSHLYRYTLTASIEQRASLAQELEIVRNYLELEKLRYGAKLEYSITCDDSVRELAIPGLLVQPLVENAIRHGVAPKLTPGNVWVHATRAGEHCRIVVQDDGDGLEHATAGSGFGLRSVQERCALLYGREYSMAISRRGGYRVELKLPLVRSPDG